jgi:hypothetical protein
VADLGGSRGSHRCQRRHDVPLGCPRQTLMCRPARPTRATPRAARCATGSAQLRPRPDAAVDEKSAVVEAGDANARALSRPSHCARIGVLISNPCQCAKARPMAARAAPGRSRHARAAREPARHQRLPPATAALQRAGGERTIDFGGRQGAPLTDSRQPLSSISVSNPPITRPTPKRRPSDPPDQKAEMQARRCA